ncbi:MAG: DUF4878 domain-containing protein [Gammaproteobacteria bacterium]|nr:DUF4878 domain-containing protein [Gammaproteobacteria bacterium]
MNLSPLFILLTIISLTSCQQSTDTPTQVAQKYWHALKIGDITAAKNLVSKNTQSNFDNYLKLPDQNKIAENEIKLGNEHAIVSTTIIENPAASTNHNLNTKNENHVSFDTVLTLEDGQWKIDASHTQIPIHKKPSDDNQLSDALEKNLNSIDQVLEDGTDMLNELIQEGSKEMNETLLRGMNKMNESLRDAINKMKHRREQQEKSQQPTNEKNDEGLI